MMLTRTAHEIAWTVQATARGHRFASIRLSAPQSGKSVCKRARAPGQPHRSPANAPANAVARSGRTAHRCRQRSVRTALNTVARERKRVREREKRGVREIK